MSFKPIMILGTGSHVGKTTIVAGLCRLFANKGINVVPFKSQNMKISTCQNPEIDIAIVYLPHISNSCDFNPLILEPNVQVRFVRSPEALGSPDLIILPGTKSTIWDLNFIRKIGWENAIKNSVPVIPIMGICGGFEMMGQTLYDPNCIESNFTESAGLGFFNFSVYFKNHKKVSQVRYRPTSHSIFKDLPQISGYEIHCGEIKYGDADLPLFSSKQGFDGAIPNHHLIFGTFIHDIFKNSHFTRTVPKNVLKRVCFVSLSD